MKNARFGALALLSATLLVGGCRGDLRDPTGYSAPRDTSQVGAGTGGGGGGGGSSSELNGTWRATFLIELPDDVQRHTVTWSFLPNGSCHRSLEIYSVIEDRTITTGMDCSFRVGSGDVTITWSGNTQAVAFRWSLANFSRDKLMLDGVTYDRLA
ncbi:MAG: hypothetical protein ABI613_02955 [Gemmatimonadota bacterium]